jgi:hypothetical protein
MKPGYERVGGHERYNAHVEKSVLSLRPLLCVGSCGGRTAEQYLHYYFFIVKLSLYNAKMLHMLNSFFPQCSAPFAAMVALALFDTALYRGWIAARMRLLHIAAALVSSGSRRRSLS